MSETNIPGGAPPALTLEERRVAAMEAHAKAQADTALAMRDAAAAQAAAMERMQPAALTREQLALHILVHLPEMTGLTDLGMVDLAIKRADAFRQRFPTA